MMERYLEKAVLWIEAVVAGILVLLTVLSLVGLFGALYRVATRSLALTPAEFGSVMSVVLEVFILIELFRIALAYMTHKNVIPTVLEAALVAVARKFVVFEPKGDFLQYAAGHAVLIVAIAVSWWFLSRAQACSLPEE